MSQEDYKNRSENSEVNYNDFIHNLKEQLLSIKQDPANASFISLANLLADFEKLTEEKRNTFLKSQLDISFGEVQLVLKGEVAINQIIEARNIIANFLSIFRRNYDLLDKLYLIFTLKETSYLDPEYREIIAQTFAPFITTLRLLSKLNREIKQINFAVISLQDIIIFVEQIKKLRPILTSYLQIFNADANLSEPIGGYSSASTHQSKLTSLQIWQFYGQTKGSIKINLETLSGFLHNPQWSELEERLNNIRLIYPH